MAAGLAAAVIDFCASEPNYVDHLAPVWRALPDGWRGTFYCSSGGPRPATARAAALELEHEDIGEDRPPAGRPIVVASIGDVNLCSRRPVALLEHGAGQTYEEPNGGYPGGPGRERVGLFLCPSDRVGDLNGAAYPQAEVAVVGVPKMDPWHRQIPPAAWGAPRRPVTAFGRPPHIAFSWHWDCGISDYSGWAWPHYRPHLPAIWRELRSSGCHLLGHAHPRAMGTIEQAYRQNSIEVVRSFDEVLARADVYVCDNSSTLFEFASTNRPVVLLNQPKWSRRVELGLRFWTHAGVGVQVDRPADLVGAVQTALQDPLPHARARAWHVGQVYRATDGCASRRAAVALQEWAPRARVQGRQPQDGHLRGRRRD